MKSSSSVLAVYFDTEAVLGVGVYLLLSPTDATGSWQWSGTSCICCSTPLCLFLCFLPYLCFHLPPYLPFLMGTAFSAALWYRKRIILWIINVLLLWLALTTFLFMPRTGRTPTGLPNQQQACDCWEAAANTHCLLLSVCSGGVCLLLASQQLTLGSSNSFSNIVPFSRSTCLSSHQAACINFICKCIPSLSFSLSVKLTLFLQSVLEGSHQLSPWFSQTGLILPPV